MTSPFAAAAAATPTPSPTIPAASLATPATNVTSFNKLPQQNRIITHPSAPIAGNTAIQTSRDAERRQNLFALLSASAAICLLAGGALAAWWKYQQSLKTRQSQRMIAQTAQAQKASNRATTPARQAVSPLNPRVASPALSRVGAAAGGAPLSPKASPLAQAMRSISPSTFAIKSASKPKAADATLPSAAASSTSTSTISSDASKQSKVKLMSNNATITPTKLTIPQDFAQQLKALRDQYMNSGLMTREIEDALVLIDTLPEYMNAESKTDARLVSIVLSAVELKSILNMVAQMSQQQKLQSAQDPVTQQRLMSEFFAIQEKATQDAKASLALIECVLQTEDQEGVKVSEDQLNLLQMGLDMAQRTHDIHGMKRFYDVFYKRCQREDCTEIEAIHAMLVMPILGQWESLHAQGERVKKMRSDNSLSYFHDQAMSSLQEGQPQPDLHQLWLRTCEKRDAGTLRNVTNFDSLKWENWHCTQYESTLEVMSSPSKPINQQLQMSIANDPQLRETKTVNFSPGEAPFVRMGGLCITQSSNADMPLPLFGEMSDARFDVSGYFISPEHGRYQEQIMTGKCSQSIDGGREKVFVGTLTARCYLLASDGQNKGQLEIEAKSRLEWTIKVME